MVDAADSGDAGAPGDSMAVAARLLERGSPLRAASVVNDPVAARAAHAAGVGAVMTFRVGAALDPAAPAVHAEGYVRSLHDGAFTQEGPAGRGMVNRRGPTAVITFGTVDVVVCTWLSGNADRQLYRAHGIEPTLYDLVVVKANTSFRASYTAFAGAILEADTPGAAAADLHRLPFRHRVQDVYPWAEHEQDLAVVVLARARPVAMSAQPA